MNSNYKNMQNINNFDNMLSSNPKNLNFYFLFVLLITGLLFSCSSNQQNNKIKKNNEMGNLIGTINTQNDEYYPYISEIIDKQELNFIRVENTQSKVKNKSKSQTCLATKVYDSELNTYISNLDLSNDFLFYSTPVLINYNNKNEVYFSGNKKSKPNIRNIFKAEYDNINNKIINISLIKELQNSAFDNSPTISNSGNLMIFASDRDTNNGLDLFYSIRMNNKWTKPINLGKNINTENDENFPFLDADGNLYFSSKIESANAVGNENKNKSENESKDELAENNQNKVKLNYDIFIAEFITNVEKNNYNWDKPKRIPNPINSDDDDICPFVFGEDLYLSSNRTGGNGGFDIYRFPLCKPFIITGKVVSESQMISVKGSIKVINSEGKIIQRKRINNSDEFVIEDLLRDNYKIIYSNDCLNDMELVQNINIPCSQIEFTKFVADFIISKPEDYFDFAKYDVPFFVSGYYKPNTIENLKELKLLFTYNLLGMSDTTQYIENPYQNYDNYSIKIENAINKATEYVIQQISYANALCGEKTQININIQIDGYTDERGFSGNAKYYGADIIDEDLNFSLMSGTPMNNELLALMRAYFTSKEITKKLEKYDIYNSNKERITWNLNVGKDTKSTKNIAKNTDKSNNNYTIKNEDKYIKNRKVSLKISIDK